MWFKINNNNFIDKLQQRFTEQPQQQAAELATDLVGSLHQRPEKKPLDSLEPSGGATITDTEYNRISKAEYKTEYKSENCDNTLGTFCYKIVMSNSL